jgi:N6-L-threonylcarbamoyladenine synthase
LIVLGVESSCDETAAAVVGPSGVLSEVIHGQGMHAAWGGVVPEIASRAHAENVTPTVREALRRAGIDRPDAVAATAGPGLIGAVLVGLSFGQGLALGWGVPFVAVNHLEGHLLAPRLEADAPAFPYLALLISGGHTCLYVVEGPGRYRALGGTVDDAVGEAFDKVARLLGLPYPGGPPLEELAKTGDPTAIPFPRPRVGELDLSLAGLKTAVRQYLERHPGARRADVAASFQEAVTDLLLDRVRAAVERTGLERLAIGGGAAANGRIRQQLTTAEWKLHAPPRARCTDNAAMIALVGRERLLAGEADQLGASARAQWAP